MRILPVKSDETARRSDKGVTLELKIYCSTEETALTLSNLLAAIAHNTAVGHSATVGAFFDGDGHDFIEVKGLPENTGRDMAAAASDYGDGMLAEVGPHSAMVYNTRYDKINGEEVQIVKRTAVWPPKDSEQ